MCGWARAAAGCLPVCRAPAFGAMEFIFPGVRQPSLASQQRPACLGRRPGVALHLRILSTVTAAYVSIHSSQPPAFLLPLPPSPRPPVHRSLFLAGTASAASRMPGYWEIL